MISQTFYINSCDLDFSQSRSEQIQNLIADFLRKEGANEAKVFSEKVSGNKSFAAIKNGQFKSVADICQEQKEKQHKKNNSANEKTALIIYLRNRMIESFCFSVQIDGWMQGSGAGLDHNALFYCHCNKLKKVIEMNFPFDQGYIHYPVNTSGFSIGYSPRTSAFLHWDAFFRAMKISLNSSKPVEHRKIQIKNWLMKTGREDDISKLLSENKECYKWNDAQSHFFIPISEDCWLRAIPSSLEVHRGKISVVQVNDLKQIEILNP